MHKLELDRLMKHIESWGRQLKANLAQANATNDQAQKALRASQIVARRYQFDRLLSPNTKPTPVEEAFKTMLETTTSDRRGGASRMLNNVTADALEPKTDLAVALSPLPSSSPKASASFLTPPVNPAQIAIQAAVAGVVQGTTNPVFNLNLTGTSPAAQVIDSLLSGKSAGDPMDHNSERREHGSGGASSLRRQMGSEFDPEEFELLKAKLKGYAHAATFQRSSHWMDDQSTANPGELASRGAAITRAEIQRGRQTNWGRNAVTPANLRGVGDAIAKVIEDEITKRVHEALGAFLRQGYGS